MKKLIGYAVGISIPALIVGYFEGGIEEGIFYFFVSFIIVLIAIPLTRFLNSLSRWFSGQ